MLELDVGSKTSDPGLFHVSEVANQLIHPVCVWNISLEERMSLLQIWRNGSFTYQGTFQLIGIFQRGQLWTRWLHRILSTSLWNVIRFKIHLAVVRNKYVQRRLVLDVVLDRCGATSCWGQCVTQMGAAGNVPSKTLLCSHRSQESTQVTLIHEMLTNDVLASNCLLLTTSYPGIT